MLFTQSITEKYPKVYILFLTLWFVAKEKLYEMEYSLYFNLDDYLTSKSDLNNPYP